MSDDDISPRVNAARLKDFVGASHPIRVTGKVLNVRPLARSPNPHYRALCLTSLSSIVFQRRNVLYYGGP